MTDHKKDNIDRDVLPPWLEDLKIQDNRPSIPEDYFEKLPDAIMDRIAAEKKGKLTTHGKGKVVAIRRIGLWVSAIAASLLLIIMIRGYDLPTSPASEFTGLEDIAPEEALSYAIENPHLYDWQEIMGTGELSEESSFNGLMPDELSTGDIIEELDDELLLELL